MGPSVKRKPQNEDVIYQERSDPDSSTCDYFNNTQIANYISDTCQTTKSKHVPLLKIEMIVGYPISLSDCLTDISLWMKSSKLKLNSDKAEFITIGTKRQRHKLSNHFPVKLLDNDICPSDSVRNLGVVFDSNFSFHKHVSNICKSCFYHIRDLRRIRRHIPLSTAKTISNALISSRLDYCNSLLNNIAKQGVSKLQRVQNCLARVVLRAPLFSPSLPLLKQLHWLPVNYRIKFKLYELPTTLKSCESLAFSVNISKLISSKLLFHQSAAP